VLVQLGRSSAEPVRCPQCGSVDTRQTSRFGSTACKSLHVCASCREPFDHFKAI
jgi:ring-1,2-phenylacetyl-CoA epoxidase subunit PaaD